MTRITQSSVGVMALLLLPCVPVSADDQQTDQPRSVTAGPSNSAPRPPWMARVFVSANGGWQLSSIDVSDSWHTSEFVEDASWTADYDVKSDLQYDGGVMVRVWKNAGIGTSFSEYRNTNGALITGQVPHPFFFERLRALSGESVGLKHEERALHISASYLLPVSPSIDLTVFGGPSIFSVTRSFVDAVTFTQSYRFDSVAFSGTNVETAKETQIGFHVGADVAWYFTRNVGVGGIARFTGASVDFATAGGDAMKIDVGGFQLGAGLRFRFGGSKSQGSERRRQPSAARPGPSAVEAVLYHRRPDQRRRVHKLRSCSKAALRSSWAQPCNGRPSTCSRLERGSLYRVKRTAGSASSGMTGAGVDGSASSSRTRYG